MRLIDTAGQRDSSDPVEQEGARRARELLPKAQLILRVVAAHEPFAPPEIELPEDVPVLLIANKSDLGRHASVPDDAIPVCALTGAGLEPLEARIESALLGGDERETVLTINARQDAALQRAAAALARAQENLSASLGLEVVSIELRDALDGTRRGHRRDDERGYPHASLPEFLHREVAGHRACSLWE